MEAINLRVTRIMDFGTIVSVIGVDLASNKPIAIHIDHRPLESLKGRDLSQPIAFLAEHLVLTLNVGVDADGGDGGEKATDARAA